MKTNTLRGLTLSALALVTVFAAAQSGIGSQSANAVQVTVNGNPVAFDAAQPQMVRGRVLVPLRGVFEQMGASVDWDADTQSVIVDGHGHHIRLRIGSFDANVNGRVVTMDVAPQLIDDSTMIPLRFLSQSLGGRVDWQPQNNAVIITTVAEAAEHFAPPPPVVQAPPPVVVTPPPPPPQTIIIERERPAAPPPPPPAPRPEMFVFSRDIVIPMRLDTELSSNNNHDGDHFVCSVRGEASRYLDFPEGTLVEGYVRSAVPASGDHAGALDLRFTHIKFPDGNRYKISGAVAPLDNKNIIMTSEGRYVIRSGRDSVVAQDAAIGAGAGLVIGAYNGKAVGGAAIGGSIGAIVGIFDHSLARNIIFKPGTKFGLILGENLSIDRHDLR